MAVTKPPRSVLAGVTLTFGLASFRVDLLPTTVSKSSKTSGTSFTTVCPTCEDAHKVNQVYVCSHDPKHGPFAAADCAKGLDSGDGLKRLTPAQVAAIQASNAEVVLPKTSDLRVFDAAEVDAATLATGNVYRLRPSKGGGVQPYLVMRELAADQSKAWLCEIPIKGVRHLYRLTAADGVLMLSELARPETMYAPEPVDGDVAAELVAKARMLADVMVEPFDAADFRDRRAERMAAIRSEMAPTATVTSIGDVGKAAADLLAVLEASVAAVKAA